MFFRKEIWGGISCLPWDFEDGLLFQLDKTYFGFSDNAFLVCPYMRPSTSPRNILLTGIDTFELLSDKLSELYNKGDIILIGDMNARTGNLTDIELDSDVEDDENLLYTEINAITSDDLTQNNMLINRHSEDKGYNSYGKRLVELCKVGNMVMLNGRAGSDKGIGKLTFNNHRGTSVNDYVLCTKNVLNNVDDFCVSDPNVFSDHSLICLKLKSNMFIPHNNDKNISCTTTIKMSWNEEKKD